MSIFEINRIGIAIPLFLIVTDAEDSGFSTQTAALLITYQGITNVIGNLLSIII